MDLGFRTKIPDPRDLRVQFRLASQMDARQPADCLPVESRRTDQPVQRRVRRLRCGRASDDEQKQSVPELDRARRVILLYCEWRPKTGFDILRPSLRCTPGRRQRKKDEGLSEGTPLWSTSSAEYAANISPDGRFFAYQSTESGGRFAIYVRPYPDASKGRWQISTGGGTAPVWSRSGNELFYLDETTTLMAVPFQTSGSQFIPGRPAKVFEDEVLRRLLLVRCDA